MGTTDYLIRRVVDGLSGWLVFQQASKATFTEHALYPAISQIAKMRGWKVQEQQKLVRMEGAAGAPKQIDFLFYRTSEAKRGKIVVLEVKYLRGVNSSADRTALLKDLKKLSSTSLENLQGFEDEDDFRQPERFLLVAAQDSAFRNLTKSNAAKNSSVAKLLKKALRDESPRAVYQTTTETYLSEDIHWIVAAFGERAWWKLIQ
jgi:hypothetical protein